MSKEDLDTIEIRTAAELRAWLTANHETSASTWIITYKKHCSDHLPWGDMVRELLCFGWIDSLKRRVDDDRTMQLISPRKPGSPWSRVNKEHLEVLFAEGRMHPAGIHKVEQARADGSWTLYDDVEAMVVPGDLRDALAEVPGAQDSFDGFADSSKKAILWWVKSAKRAKTRDKRISETARLAGLGLRANFPEAKGR